MADHIRLYSRPLVMDDVAAALSITGTLPEYTPGESFEGRLQINNSVGRCRVELLPDSVLPEGAAVRVDNVTKEVVLKWGAYQIVDPIEQVPVINGDFEDGDDGSWINHHTGWDIIDGAGIGGGHAARFYNARGICNYVGLLAPVSDPSKVIKLTAQIQHGASSKGNVVAGVYLLWYDANRNLLRWTNGDLVRSGSNGEWKPSTVEAAAGDTNVKFVAPGLTANRKKQNKPLFADNVVWNHAYRIGQNSYEDYKVHLKVTDSLNRVAYWSGFLSYASLFLTSTLYQIDAGADSLFTGYANNDFIFYEGVKQGDAADAGTATYVLGGFIFETAELAIQEEPAGVAFSLGGFLFRGAVVEAGDSVAANTSYAVGGFTFKEIAQGLGTSPANTAYTLGGFTFQ